MMNTIEFTKEHFIKQQIKNDVKNWLIDNRFTNFTTDDIEFVGEMVSHYLSNKNTIIQFENRNYIYFKKYKFFLRYLSYLAMIFVGRNNSCDFKFVTEGNLLKKDKFFSSLMKKINVQCNVDFISYQDFIKNPVIDKYTIINHYLDEELTKILSKVSWNHGIIILG